MEEHDLNTIRDMIKHNNLIEARKEIVSVIQKNPNNHEIWLLAAEVSNNQTEKDYCYKKASTAALNGNRLSDQNYSHNGIYPKKKIQLPGQNSIIYIILLLIIFISSIIFVKTKLINNSEVLSKNSVTTPKEVIYSDSPQSLLPNPVEIPSSYKLLPDTSYSVSNDFCNGEMVDYGQVTQPNQYNVLDSFNIIAENCHGIDDARYVFTSLSDPSIYSNPGQTTRIDTKHNLSVINADEVIGFVGTDIDQQTSITFLSYQIITREKNIVFIVTIQGVDLGDHESIEELLFTNAVSLSNYLVKRLKTEEISPISLLGEMKVIESTPIPNNQEPQLNMEPVKTADYVNKSEVDEIIFSDTFSDPE